MNSYFGTLRLLSVLMCCLWSIVACDTTPATTAAKPLQADSTDTFQLDELKLFTMPSAVNLDSQPGPDGFAAKIYAVRHSEAKPVAINGGKLEILLYEGVHRDRLPDGKPIQIWTWKASELKQFQYQSAIGFSYNFVLRWPPNITMPRQITVFARFVPANGIAVYTRPISLALFQK